MSFWKSLDSVKSLFLLCLVMAVAGGCGTLGPATTVEEPPPPQLGLMPGDTLMVSYRGPGAPDDFSAKIRDDGYITVPPAEIGSLFVQGKSVGEVQKELQAEIDKYYRQLVVTVNDVRFFYVRGYVNGQNRLQYQENLTLLSAIAAAGDFATFANKSRIELNRDGKKYYLDAELARKDPSYDFRIYPRDEIFVPRRNF